MHFYLYYTIIFHLRPTHNIPISDVAHLVVLTYRLSLTCGIDV